jgi:hypothetical protein
MYVLWSLHFYYGVLRAAAAASIIYAAVKFSEALKTFIYI